VNIIAKALAAAAAALAMAAPGMAAGPQGYPDRAVTIVAPFSAGGSTDAAARMLADELSRRWSVPVIVENRPGGGGRIGALAAARAKPDGYTLVILSAGSGTILPASIDRARLGYGQEDFAPLSLLVTSPPVLLVHPDSGIRTTQELIDRLRGDPGKYTYGTNGIASTQHMTGAVFLNRIGADGVVHVPYRGSSESLVGVASGQLTFMFDNAVTALPFAATGRVRALAVASARRFDMAPDLPTVAESGVPGFQAMMWLGLATQDDVPADILDFLNESVTGVLRDAAFQEKLRAQSFVAEPMSREAFARFLKDEAEQATDIIRKNRIVIE